VANQYIVMVTKHGVIKKSELTEFDNPMSRGIIAVSLDEGDELIGAKITHGNNYMFLARTKARRSASARKTCGRWAARRAAYAP
jgi:Type IIA topoisomerase (DNA gyrase/topo II, topoisomerase IV), A subunit